MKKNLLVKINSQKEITEFKIKLYSSKPRKQKYDDNSYKNCTKLSKA